jgi:methyltransferase-like protein
MKIRNNIALSDSGFLFDPASGDSFSLNPIGLEILRMLKSGKEKEDILPYLLENYQTDEVTVEKDYYDFIRSLQQFYLVEAEGE